MEKNRIIKIIAGIIISIILLVFLFLKINLSSVKNAFISFNYSVISVLLLVYIASMLMRTFRWQKLISQNTNLSLWFVFKSLSIGYMINNLLPAKVGELARMEFVKRKTGIGRSFLLGTIFIERIIDLFLVLIIFAFSLLFSQTGRSVFMHNKWIFLILFILITASVYLMLKPELILRIIKILPAKIKSSLEKIAKSFSESIRFISNPNLLVMVSTYSVIIWILTLLSSFLILRGLEVYLPFYGYFFLVAVGVLGLVIPSTSGGIGVFHAIATGALILLNVESEKALTYAIIAHAFDFFPNVIVGLLVTAYDGLSFKSLKPLPNRE